MRGGHPRDRGGLQAARVHHAGVQVLSALLLFGRGSEIADRVCCVLHSRYYRLPLPVEGAPLEEDFDAFVNILRVSPTVLD